MRREELLGIINSIGCVFVRHGGNHDTKILKRVGLNLFQGTKKSKVASLKESLKDYPRNASNNWVKRTPRNVGIVTQYRGGPGYPKLYVLKYFSKNDIIN